ncbi:MAG TPA: TonB-dependent receptor [Caldimonas sp.]|nr:TonB-dependent receptor [Caldimonas sp.]HEX4233879.1 TonB-dependent receptor [Caldimonas sp.]
MRLPLAALVAVGAFVGARAQQSPAPQSTAAVVAEWPSAQQLAPVEVRGNYLNSVGSTDAASAGTVTSKLIESRPTLRPAEVLEFVPGVIVTQHSGEGKANQYYLRGFNLDHGTDFATFVDGMPVNMPTHAHGQGYSDLNWLIPELVERIRYRKGPYYAEEGDFSSAGSARIGLLDALPHGIGSVTLGEDRFARALIANSNAIAIGKLLYAIEAAHDDGPWHNPEKFHRLNGVVRYSFGADGARSSLTAMGYSAAWNSTDQIPQRAVDSGLIGRFGALDATDGGQTERYSVSFATSRQLADGGFDFNAYAIRSKLDLYSNFTFFLEHPIDLDPTGIDGDQFHQAEHRKVFGLATRRSWDMLLGGHDSTTTIGFQLRHDRLDPVGLYSTVARQFAQTTQESHVRETSVALYADNRLEWTSWLRSTIGIRGDRFYVDHTSSIAENSGKKNAGLISPKLSLIFGPWLRTEYFANYGYGYHSNDARGATERVKPKEFIADPTDPDAVATPSPLLVRSKGGELGLRTEIVPGLQASLAVWQLRLGSELVFSGDAGDTEAGRASQREGIEFNNHYIAAPWLLVDGDLAVSRARFTTDDPTTPGRYIPGSVDTVVSLGATVLDRGPWFGHFQLRYFGPRPLIEDNSVRSKATTLAYLRVGYRLAPSVRVALDVFNLFDRKASDIDYFYASRLRGEPAAGVDDVHFHPVEPRRFRLTLLASF